MTKLLIDGDILLYRCAFAAEKTYYLVEHEVEKTMPKHFDWIMKFDSHKEAMAHVKEAETFSWPSVVWSRKEIQPEEFAFNAANTLLSSLVGRFDTTDVQIFLSDGQTFRDRIAVTKKYKGNRDSIPKPTHYKALREFLLSKGAIVTTGHEADDVMAVEHTRNPKNTIICTIDKDLNQIPGTHFNWVDNELYTISKREGDFNLFSQLLTGDSTDNVPGLPNKGPAFAKRTLDGAGSRKDLYGRCREAYSTQPTGYFEEQFRLVYILRNSLDPEEGLKVLSELNS